MARQRIEQQPAFVLHTQPWRETSLIVELFSREHGRLPLVAKGARRPTSAFRGLLMGFQPLLADWSGGGEVRTLARVEWQGGVPLLAGRALLSGYYLNELLVSLMPREDAHPALYDDYRATLVDLAAGKPIEAALRRFEFALLAAMGYMPDLARCADSGAGVADDRDYLLIIEKGFVERAAGARGPAFGGRVLRAIRVGDYADEGCAAAAKQISRTLINHHLGGRELQSRRVFTEFAEL
ncbi:MAG: DNA repair protein RecO [Rhodocyclaceae bacterium]|nr:DNA repair protein RecO [Rhodocyclaceae bacterium]